MVKPEEVRSIALSFEGADEKPHFHRTAFTINKKIFATLTVQENIINLMFDLPTQFIFCPPNSDVIFPVPNKWGLKGATTINLHKANKKLVTTALRKAYNLRKEK